MLNSVEDLRAEDQGKRNQSRSLRLPHDGRERHRRCRAPQGDAGDPDRTQGMGNLAHRAAR